MGLFVHIVRCLARFTCIYVCVCAVPNRFSFDASPSKRVYMVLGSLREMRLRLALIYYEFPFFGFEVAIHAHSHAHTTLTSAAQKSRTRPTVYRFLSFRCLRCFFLFLENNSIKVICIQHRQRQRQHYVYTDMHSYIQTPSSVLYCSTIQLNACNSTPICSVRQTIFLWYFFLYERCL